MKIQRQKFIIGLLVLTMLTLYGSYPVKTEAVSMKSVRDTISSSNISQANVTHVIMATTTTAVPQNGFVAIVFPAAFTNVSSVNLTCPNAGTAGGGGNVLTCTYTAAGGLPIGAWTFQLTGTTNPATVGSQMLEIESFNGATLLDNSTFRVAIVNSVAVTATVQASLTFSIYGLASSTPYFVNGVQLTGSSTYNALPFGVLTPGVKKTLGQRLNVSTNANYGYTVTVVQNQNLTASNGATIARFSNGAAASTTPLVWGAPTGILGNSNTYGHFGVTSGDTTLSNGTNPFGGSLYKGFWHSPVSGEVPIEVMYNNGPADGLTNGIGSSTVAYSIQISPLQQAGDYSNTLTYVCTPTY